MSKIIAGGGQKHYKIRSNLSTCLLDQKNSGTVLIEFAICIPILVILLFYAHDLVKLYRYQSQTEFVGQQMVNLIQNISQNRENKKITKTDIKYIITAVSQTIYPGLTMFYRNSIFELGHVPMFCLFYVKGLAGGKASCIWRIAYYIDYINASAPSSIPQEKHSNDYSYYPVRYKTNVNPSEIDPSLKISEGEEKILISLGINAYNGASFKYKYNLKQALGFYLVNPKYLTDGSRRQTCYSVTIFTPKPGLFDETGPQ